MEAKLAWYGPQVGIGSDLSATKALPADLPDLVLSKLSTLDQLSSRIPFILLSSFAVSWALIEPVLQWSNTLDGRRAFPDARYFSSNLFFRPPPFQ